MKREAKRWLKALRAGDADVHTRLDRVVSSAVHAPASRDVQHAIAIEYGPHISAHLSKLDDVPFGIVYGVSDNATRFWSLEAGRALYGFWPVDGVR